MNAEESMSTPVFFRPRARMMHILGDDLIRDNTVGLMELVKNGYDADAQAVRVELYHVLAPDLTTVIVQDDGDGMNEQTLRGPWLEPAHGGKEQQKRRGTRTPLGRLPLGEKGVGRFAVQKLGRVLELVTRPVGEAVEYVMNIDWDAFETNQYLDEVPLLITSRQPLVFTEEQAHGTRLTMHGARRKWTKEQIQRFQASLIRLLSPVTTVEHFSVDLVCPEYTELESLEPDDILENYQYRIDCLVDQDGTADFEYRYRLPGQEEQLMKGKEALWSQLQAKRKSERPMECGPFLMQISAWMLDDLKTYSMDREQLRILAGVSIYRDGFRILPYGDEGDDWLGLDKRRINVPGKRFSNQQVIGIVEIIQGVNIELVDKTNREGLQENQAYYDFRDLVLGVIELFEMQSREQRQNAQPARRTKKDLEQQVTTLQEQVRHLQERPALPLTPSVQPVEIHIIEREHLDDNGQEPTYPQEELEGAVVETTSHFSSSAPSENTIPVSKEELAEIIEQTREIQAGLRELDETEDVDSRNILLHLMGLGLATERFAHEFDRMVEGSLRSLQTLRSHTTGNGGNQSALDHLSVFVNALRNEVRLMGTLSYVRRKQAAQVHSVRHIVDLILQVHEQELKEAFIQVEYSNEDDFEVHISEASLAQVLDNVIDNAIYWLRQKGVYRERNLRIELAARERTVFISNNGPSIVAHIPRRLFKYPFVSAKIGGRGLGMYIASEILKQSDGTIALVNGENTRVLSGAAFAIRFSREE